MSVRCQGACGEWGWELMLCNLLFSRSPWDEDSLFDSHKKNGLNCKAGGEPKGKPVAFLGSSINFNLQGRRRPSLLELHWLLCHGGSRDACGAQALTQLERSRLPCGPARGTSPAAARLGRDAT